MRGTIAPMALGPSVRLGAYEIVESIGAGGMGEVYRARDARLDAMQTPLTSTSP